MLSWLEETKRRLSTLASGSSVSPSFASMSRSFTTSSLGSLLGGSFPKKSTRYLHAMGAMGFLVTIVTAMDMMTTTQLKNSPYFEYSFKAVRQNKDVQELLGTSVNSPWRVTVKKHKRRFQLTYSVKGERGNWAQVIAASTIDGKRAVIDDECFRYIVVQPTTLRKICFGVVTDGLYDLAAIVGKEYWFSETEEEARKRRETEIVVVDHVDVHSSASL